MSISDLEEKGYLYIATGEKYLEEAIKSAKSLKKIRDDARTCLITDVEFQHDAFDIVRVERDDPKYDQWKTALLLKIKGLLLSPFKKTLFIDSDTYFYDACDELFDMLEYHDFLIGHDYSDDSLVTMNGKVLANYTPYNTGVMGIRNNEVMENMITQWYETYTIKFDEYWSDQPALMEVLLSHPVKTYFLHTIYNFRHLVNIGILAGQKVKILHARGNAEEFKLLERKLNKHTDQRAWIAPRSKVYFWPSKRIVENPIKKVYQYLPESFKNLYRKLKYN